MRRTGLSCPDAMVPYMPSTTCAPCDSGLAPVSTSSLPEWLQGEIDLPLIGQVPKVLALLIALGVGAYLIYHDKK